VLEILRDTGSRRNRVALGGGERKRREEERRRCWKKMGERTRKSDAKVDNAVIFL
jgi:hypothetical protein